MSHPSSSGSESTSSRTGGGGEGRDNHGPGTGGGTDLDSDGSRQLYVEIMNNWCHYKYTHKTYKYESPHNTENP